MAFLILRPALHLNYSIVIASLHFLWILLRIIISSDIYILLARIWRCDVSFKYGYNTSWDFNVFCVKQFEIVCLNSIRSIYLLDIVLILGDHFGWFNSVVFCTSPLSSRSKWCVAKPFLLSIPLSIRWSAMSSLTKQMLSY